MPPAAAKDGTCERCCLAREVLGVQPCVRDTLDVHVAAMRAKGRKFHDRGGYVFIITGPWFRVFHGSRRKDDYPVRAVAVVRSGVSGGARLLLRCKYLLDFCVALWPKQGSIRRDNIA